MLRVDSLHASYGDSHVLRGASLAIEQGSALGLLGRNGMGKTTLIRTVMGFVRATSGKVEWDGQDVSGSAPERMARLGIGYVPEGRGIFPNLSVRENLVMAARSGVDGRCDWTFERVLATFPRLAERLAHGGHRRPRAADRRRDLARDRRDPLHRHRHAHRRPRLPPRAQPHRPGRGAGERRRRVTG
jgi:branched-chain amino acid transport system ATP-binding protein